MKTFKHILWTLLAGFAASGCAEDPSYTPGAEEDPNSYGVYFPLQSTPTKIEISTSDPTDATFVVRRTKSLDAITVPVVVSASEEGIFEIEPIVFEDGEDLAEFTVSFDNAVKGTTYTCNIRIEDPRYISIYGPKETSLSFSVVRADWELVTSQDGSANKGKWRDNLVGNLYSINSPTYNPYPEIEVEIYQRSDIPGYYRMKVYGQKLMEAMAGGSVNVQSKDVYTVVDARDPQKVYIPYQSTGLTINPSDGDIRIGSQVPENFVMDGSTSQYGTLVDGVITFPAQSVQLELGGTPGAFYAGNREGMLRILLPGVVVPDYTVKLTKGEPENGVVEIDAELARDVHKVRYAIFEGVLDEGQAGLKAQELDAKKEQQGTFAGEITSSSSIRVENKTTGKYTLIGCIYDRENTMQSYASVAFGYVAQDDSKPVVLTVGLELTNEYAGQGINKENSMKFYAYGQDIESATYGFFRSSQIAQADKNTLLDKQGTPFTQEQIEILNSKGLSSMLTGLNGDSEYTMLVRANNGYVTKLIETKLRTEGTFNPGLEKFTYADFLPDDKQPSQEKLKSTTWNYYAIDVNKQEENPIRRKIGEVTFSDNPELSQELGVTTLSIKGLSGITFDEGGDAVGLYMPQSNAFPGYKGVIALYTSDKLAPGIYNGQPHTQGFVPSDFSGVYFAPGGMYFGAVADGYLYCVPSPAIQEEAHVSFMFYFTGTTSGITTLMTDMMLVDPEKDMGGIPSGAADRMAAIRRAAAQGFKPRNFVELDAATQGGYGQPMPAELPANLAPNLMPASAPTAKQVEAHTTVVPRRMQPAAAGTAQFVKTGVRIG